MSSRAYGALVQAYAHLARTYTRCGLAYYGALPSKDATQRSECTLPPKFHFVGADEALEPRQSESLLGVRRLFIPCNERKSDRFRVE